MKWSVYDLRTFVRLQKREVASKKEMFEIGERLNVKLQDLREHLTNEVNNYTCVLKKCGVLNSNGELNTAENIIEAHGDINYPDANENGTPSWLQEHFENDIRLCVDVSLIA